MQRELELDEKALSNLRTDRQRFLCKAVENYIRCLERGEEHDTWVFRLASLWLENADIKVVNNAMKVGETSEDDSYCCDEAERSRVCGFHALLRKE